MLWQCLLFTSKLNVSDIDEFSNSTHNCYAQATCTNTDGSFTCACISGYTGNGTACTSASICLYSSSYFKAYVL